MARHSRHRAIGRYGRHDDDHGAYSPMPEVVSGCNGADPRVDAFATLRVAACPAASAQLSKETSQRGKDKSKFSVSASPRMKMNIKSAVSCVRSACDDALRAWRKRLL